jgi:hypothetical protein
MAVKSAFRSSVSGVIVYTGSSVSEQGGLQKGRLKDLTTFKIKETHGIPLRESTIALSTRHLVFGVDNRVINETTRVLLACGLSGE